MDVQRVVLADQTNVADRDKLNIMGIFDTIWLPTFVVLGLCLALPSVLRGQDSSRASCDSAATALNMRRCFEHALRAAERDLQRYVDEAHRRAANRALLDSAEGAWRRYRDLACRAAGSQEHGGTTKDPAVLRCLLDLTRRRMREVYRHYLRATETALPEPES